MSMLNSLTQTLGQALNPKANDLIKQISDTIVINVPDRMKYTIAVSVLTTFASQFRRSAELKDGTICPTNAITVIAAGSGVGKDSSYKMASKAFAKAYKIIDAHVEDTLVQKAIEEAQKAGEELPSVPEVYNNYRKYCPTYETAFTTAPGFVALAEEIMTAPLGAPLVVTSEMSDEFSSNKDTDELIKALAISYDLGDIPAKNTKGSEFRSKKLTGVPTNALLMGSYNILMYNEAVRHKFINALASKLARRSIIYFNNEVLPEPDFSNDPLLLLEYEEVQDDKAAKARELIEDYFIDVAKYGITHANTPLPVSTEVDQLFKLYRRYNKDYVAQSTNPDSLSSLVRLHNQWRALKLSSTFAFIEKASSIQKHHYEQAMQFIEMLSDDIHNFETEISKSPYEHFADFMKTQVQENGKAVISVYDLKKNNYVTSVSHGKLQELVHLASGYDTSGIYSIINEGGALQYEPIIKTEVVGISFKPIDCTRLNIAITNGDSEAVRTAKHDISVTTAYGFDVNDTTFNDLSNLLEGDYAYSPFKFRNGVRGKENILGGTKWVVLDIDDSPITASEAHFMLSDINHHIALSSDPDNEYKFRVLIELDSTVELSPIAWKHFYLGIAEDLALRVDPLPQSQIFFSYADRPVISNLDASPLEARPYLIRAKELEADKKHKDQTFTSAQKSAQLKDPLTTFNYAFEAPWGSASRNVIRAMYHLRELGGSLEDAKSLYADIQEYWDVPFEEVRSEAMQNQIARLF